MSKKIIHMKSPSIIIGTSKDNKTALIDVKSDAEICCMLCVIKHLTTFLQEITNDHLAATNRKGLH